MTVLVGGNFTAAFADLNAGNAAGLGDVAEDYAGNRYVFVQASGAVAQYDAVQIGSTYVAQALTKALADTGLPVGVAMGTLTSASYGWACIKGVTSVNVLQTCSSSTALYTSGTAGKLDDTTTSQDKIAGVVITANNTTTATQAIACVIAGNPYPAI
jgi:hypothetical protein